MHHPTDRITHTRHGALAGTRNTERERLREGMLICVCVHAHASITTKILSLHANVIWDGAYFSTLCSKKTFHSADFLKSPSVMGIMLGNMDVDKMSTNKILMNMFI